MISKIVNTFITVVNTNACAICKYFHRVLRQREKVGETKKLDGLHNLLITNICTLGFKL